MPNESKCRKCGAPLTPDARDGVCPKCLLGQVLASADKSATTPIERSAVPSVPALVEGPGTIIGRYKLREKVGEGGCGVVYVADQEEPVRRRVALKVIKPGMDTKQILARFEAERQALAMMDHPNIAKVLDGGRSDTGRPYFVMELVRGIKITEYCDQAKLATDQRLELFIQVCHAVQHAHQKGIIHRDLKPSNILVTLHDGVPVPKVIDFGIAKATEGRLTDLTMYTELHAFLGTPAYMSPEQAEMSGLDIDTRTDIYSLGVLLYQLLTDKTPFEGKELLALGLDEMRRTIREKEPLRPSTRLASLGGEELTTTAQRRSVEVRKLIHLLRGDLDWIVMKCLEKDRTRRYETANGLAMDLERHLQNEPVVARPPSKFYRVGKMVRRNKLAFAAGAAVVTALVVGLAVSMWQFVEKSKAYQRVVAAEAEAQTALANEASQRHQTQREQVITRQNLYAADMFLVQHALEEGNYGLALQVLEAHRPKPGQKELRGFEWRYLWKLSQGESLATLPAHSNTVSCLALSPDGQTLASGSWDHHVKLWDVSTRRVRTTLPPLKGGMNSIAFSPDGRLLAVGSDGGLATLWDLATEKLIASFEGRFPRVAFSPANQLLAVGKGSDITGRGGSTEVSLWDCASQKTIRTIANSGARITFSPDGRILASGSRDNVIMLWEVATGAEWRVLTNSGFVISLAISPDGQTLAASTWEGAVNLWDVSTGQQKPPLSGHTARVWSIGFSPDGQTLATASSDQSVGLWDVQTQRSKGRLKGHSSEVWSVVFLLDGKTLVSGSKDEALKVWSADRERIAADSDFLFHPVFAGDESGSKNSDKLWRVKGEYQPEFSDDGRYIASATGQGHVKVWDTHTKEVLVVFTNETFAVAFTERGRTLVTLGIDYSLKFWDWEKRHLRTRRVLSPIPKEERLGVVRLASGAKALATATLDGKVSLWNPDDGSMRFANQAHRGKVWSMDFSPDGRLLATAGSDRTARIIELATQTEIAVLRTHRDQVLTAVFSPDGTILATGSSDNTVKLWEVKTWKELSSLTGHKEGLGCAAFSPDGFTLATGSDDNVVKLWHMATYRELATFKHEEEIWAMTFSPDGRKLGITSPGGLLRLWHAPTLAEIDGDFSLNPLSGPARQ